MLPDFDPISDWFSPLAAAIGAEDFSRKMRIQTAAGLCALERRLAAASSMHGASEWLAQTATHATGLELAEGMITAVIAADHLEAGLVCPQKFSRRLRGRAWQTYAQRRAEQTLNRLPDALMRWSVLECIPVRWVVKETVFEQLSARFAGEGYADIRIAGELADPFPGGTEWLAGECAPECEALKNGTAGAVRAAVIIWPARAVPAVVVTANARCHAYAPGLNRNGIALKWDGADCVAALVLLPPFESPPASFLMALSRLLRLNAWASGTIRTWRVRRQSEAKA